MSDRCPHGECDGTGFVIDEATNTARPCRCRPERAARARAARLSARLPTRYKDVAFERKPVLDMDAVTVSTVKRFVNAIGANLDAGRGLWIMGDVGTGKTTLAMLVSKAALRAGRSVAIYSLPRLLAELNEAVHGEGNRTYLPFIDELTSVDLLHLDDLGYQGDSAWVVEQLFSIVNSRYEEQRSMVITSLPPPESDEPDESGDRRSATSARAKSKDVGRQTRNGGPSLKRETIEQQLGHKTVSRLREMCDELPLFGHDRRETFAPVD